MPLFACPIGDQEARLSASACELIRYITHTPFVISPTLAILDPNASTASKTLSTGVTRARFFNYE
ncbi:hypothetical protein p1B236 (plasmid) [Aromatoleum aromaticum EbN1]|jgi:hypothetical protein|uniref:Uncharacterized protein n=1 Tax=Aromatoleum aromaticum (strain DSM 19018 / LMG 30748 / EbN1) TaxID=76114 RepID=Q5NWY6_AROAE|nr:hypothetical protein p1B236 [Aromatoleum aromaticum EbN1]